MIERISLNSLKFFYFVAQYGSVTLASKKLFVTQSAVSKQIYNLEESLDLQLFERKNKSLLLTHEGELLFQCCEKIFSQLDECLITLKKDQQASPQLVLSCESTLSMKWLIPRLTKFKTLDHGFDVVLLTGGGQVDFEKNNIDLAIRRNDFQWEAHLFSEKIADEYMVMVQSPHVQQVNELLLSTSRPNFFKKIKQFEPFKSQLKTLKIVELEHFYLCLEGCLAGLGATIMSIYMIEKELQWQSLKATSSLVHDGSCYYLLSQTAFEADPRKLIFLEWLKEEMAESQKNFL